MTSFRDPIVSRLIVDCSGSTPDLSCMNSAFPLLFGCKLGTVVQAKSPSFIPLKGLTELNLPRADLNLIYMSWEISYAGCENTGKVSNVISGPRWPPRYFIKR